MPKSKQRRTTSKGRSKAREAKARETQASQRRAETKPISLQSYQRRQFLGWTFVVLGVGVAVQHLISHMGFYTLISSGWDDLVAGYPMGGALGIVGAMMLSK